MADIVDEANDKAAVLLAATLLNHRRKAIVATPGIGLCLNCGEDVEGERRWCSPDCRDDWQLEQKRRERK